MTAAPARNPSRPGAAQPDAACEHCGLPVPNGVADPRFCCRGCATVYELLHDDGLARFYELGGGRGQPADVGGAESQRDWLADAISTDPSTGMTRATVDVQGIHCAACVWLLQEVWRRFDGTLGIRINPSIGRMELSFDADALDLGAFFDRCAALGYRVGPQSDDRAEAHAIAADRSLLIRLGTSAALAMNAMVFAFSEYLGMSAADGGAYTLFNWLSFAFATAAVAIGGPVFARAAWAGIRQRVLHLDLPIALGIAFAYASSTFGFFTGTGAAYFDTVTVFVALMLAGRYVQRRAVRRNRAYLLDNDGSEHVRVRRLAKDGAIENVLADDLSVGDVLTLAPGDLVPVRATLRSAATTFSLDWIDGESEPRRFDCGADIPAGAFVAGRCAVTVEARSTAADSGLGPLLAVPPERELAAGDGFWQWLNRGYVAVVLVIATLAGFLWAAIDPSRVVGVVTSVLVVTCPCAIGIAMPLAFDLALARLRRHGVFVRRAGLLDRLRHVSRVVFDKTGTLTWGGVRVERAEPPCPNADRDILFTMALSSHHPTSRAVAESLTDRAALPPRFVEGLSIEDVPGRGVRAQDADGHEYRLGSADFAGVTPEQLTIEARCVFSRDGALRAAFCITEDLRLGADAEIAALQARGVEVALASGDRQARVTELATQVGLLAAQAHGDLSPEQKARFITNGDAAQTLMVGDGLNDALAFDAAGCAGTPALDRPVLPRRADFFYAGAGTGAVEALFATSARFYTVTRQNLWLAGLYNAAALTLCLAGQMSPLLVAILMPLSSLALIANTLRGLAPSTLSNPGDPA